MFFRNEKLILNEIELCINTALKSVMVGKYFNRKINTLSGGQQGVGIVRDLAKNTVCIIADEPTGNLDSKNSDKVMDILYNIAVEMTVKN